MPASTFSLDGLPPVVQLLLREVGAHPEGADAHKFFKRLFPELQRQAEWTFSHLKQAYPDPQTDSTMLCINPSSGLDPFSRYGKCFDFKCRTLNADQIARTVGLYADVALIGDTFTEQALFTDRWTRGQSDLLMGDLIALFRLIPLFCTGTFRFISNIGAFCKTHQDVFTSQVDDVCNQLASQAESTLQFSRQGDFLSIESSEFSGIPMFHRVRLNAKQKLDLVRVPDLRRFGMPIYRSLICGEVHETLFKMRRVPTGAIAFSNTRASLLAARHVDGNQLLARDAEIWEADRSVKLPWVSNLSVENIVRLRDAADRALPSFRAKMARAMADPDINASSKLAFDLREQAAEVEAELAALDAPGEAKFRTIAGLVGMTISVYGYAGEIMAPGAALGGLATLLGLLHAGGHKERMEVAKLTSRPGYVLVKAKELARHADQVEAS
jgi:hypothetical protein